LGLSALVFKKVSMGLDPEFRKTPRKFSSHQLTKLAIRLPPPVPPPFFLYQPGGGRDLQLGLFVHLRQRQDRCPSFGRERIAEKLKELETDDIDVQQRLERELKRDYHIITAGKRLDQVARDSVQHYSTAWETGKAMLVCID